MHYQQGELVLVGLLSVSPREQLAAECLGEGGLIEAVEQGGGSSSSPLKFQYPTTGRSNCNEDAAADGSGDSDVSVPYHGSI